MKAPDVQAVKTSRRTNAILLTLLFACGAAAQAPAERKRPAQTPKPATTNRPAASQAAKPSAKSARARDRRERQSAAAALEEAASRASGVEDTYKRTLILALAADALWLYDEQPARALLSRAWESAVASDEAATKSLENDLRKGASAQNPSESSEGLPEDLPRVTLAREEVLSAASRHDARLTELYLAELRESVKAVRGDDAAQEDERRRHDVEEFLSEFDFDQTRLNLSRSLAEEGDYPRAAEVAAPEVAGGVSAALVRFLIQFRERAPAEADGLYRRLLARAASDPRAGANDVLLLSSYTLTPSMLASVNADGSVNFASVGGVTRPNSDPQSPFAQGLMREFFETAAAVLTRPARTPNGHGESAATFFAVTRLLPYFERDAPRLVPQLQARLASLSAELDARSRDSLSGAASRKNLTSTNPVDPLAADAESAKTGQSAPERDASRARLVMRAVKLKLWGRAREAAEAMEDPERRADYLRLIVIAQAASVAEAFEEDEDGDEHAAKFVENADVPPLTRALCYARAALLASKLKRPARAAELLDRAQTFAEQTDAGTEARLVALLVVAYAADELDTARAWASLPALVRAANEVRDSSQEDLSGGFRLPHVEGVEGVGLSEELAGFRLDRLFELLGARDFGRALAEARALDDPATRTLVIIAAARGRLAAAPAPETKVAR